MSRFPELLQSLGERLVLPQPARSRVLLEIADDLEGLYRHYRESGLDDDAARRRAADTIDVTPDVLADLIDVHASPYQRFLDNLSAQARARWEHGLLGAVSAFLCVIVALTARAYPVFERADVFVWPVLLCFVAAAVVGLRQAYGWFVPRGLDRRRTRRNLRAVLMLGAAQPLLAVVGIWLGLLRVSYAVFNGERLLGPALFDWIYGAVALLLVAVGGGIVTALWWFALAGRAAVDEEREALWLLESNELETTS